MRAVPFPAALCRVSVSWVTDNGKVRDDLRGLVRAAAVVGFGFAFPIHGQVCNWRVRE